MTIDDVGEGAMLADKYRIERVLGRGGMGVVVEATHVGLDERVAIKFLSADHIQNREARERFAREARATVRLRSEHIARVRDIGELGTGQPYIVMELLAGRDLARTLHESGMTPGTVVDLMLHACEALAEAHALGIVHRDIKPANLFVTWTIDQTPWLKLLDFGVATAPAGEIHLTSTGVTVGTPAYMCPEQMRSARAAEPRWDIWSLGVVMYEAFEGVLPFAGDAFAELAVSVLTEPPRPMTRTGAGLRVVVERCLAKDPAGRYRDVAELAIALASHAGDRAAAEVAVGRTLRHLGRSADSAARGAMSAGLTEPMPSASPGEIAISPSAPTVSLDSSPVVRAAAIAVSAPRLTAAGHTDLTSDGHLAVARPRRWPLVLGLTAVAGGVVVLAVWLGGGNTPTTTPAAASLVDAAGALAAPVDAGPGPVDAAIIDTGTAVVDAADTTPRTPWPDAASPAAMAPDARGSTPPGRRPDAGRPTSSAPVDAAGPVTPTAPPDARTLTEQELMKGRT